MSTPDFAALAEQFGRAAALPHTRSELTANEYDYAAGALDLLASAPEAETLERFARYMNDGQPKPDRGEWLMVRDYITLSARAKRGEEG